MIALVDACFATYSPPADTFFMPDFAVWYRISPASIPYCPVQNLHP
ncbi:hypothetical protein BIFPSEUDO_04103 [Bifidobacterium pseudocatenulatum DSM 20438 = JCM 1200 = LMG 10505]|jgi:hypothetical protein|uniref:Uncharacterized protein n=1 Tax=Bifidobacterium pseudocatenulatum DSM 20438 = JCM 1200 = LMG 10505 TaxID=547043 RepID=C0BUL6_BIFPS|nr:hypothetical protein BIFPSEUDO_04103 [Bifidobacterium pseudocatenulatum DSM 20438 = JCM 1200 = LMG 10505]